MGIIKEWRAGDLDMEDVTAVDHAAETAMLEVLREASPDIPAVGEMSGGNPNVDRVWVIDPMDGTTNFVQVESFVAVTLALLVDGQPVVGATGCPFTGELWSASKGAGTYDNSGRRMIVEPRASGHARVALDPQVSGERTSATWMEVFQRLTSTFNEVHPLSAIALELAHVAAGDYHGFVQVGGSRSRLCRWRPPHPRGWRCDNHDSRQ